MGWLGDLGMNLDIPLADHTLGVTKTPEVTKVTSSCVCMSVMRLRDGICCVVWVNGVLSQDGGPPGRWPLG